MPSYYNPNKNLSTCAVVALLGICTFSILFCFLLLIYIPQWGVPLLFLFKKIPKHFRKLLQYRGIKTCHA